ncbi:MAG: acyl-CoA thioesterase [Pseudomonadota bacterium]
MQPALKTIAMPADANPNGDIFGGWLLSQMDLAGAAVAYYRAGGRIATIAVDGMSFLQPVFIGDLVSFYAQVVRVGTTSLRVRIDSYVRRRRDHSRVKVTEGVFTYVAIDDEGRPRPVPPDPDTEPASVID